MDPLSIPTSSDNSRDNGGITPLSTKKTSRRIAFLAVFLMVTVWMAACSGENDENNAESRGDERREVLPTVIFDLADDKPLYHYVETQGTVEPLNAVTLYNRLGGFVDRHLIREGRHVTAGDTILALQDDEWQLAVKQARFALDKAASDYDIEREQRLRNSGTEQLPDEMIRFLQNVHGLSEARVRLQRAELDLSYTSLIAPFDGQIHTRRNDSRGQYLAAGTELGQLVDDSQVRVRFDLLESELATVEEGMRVELETGFGYRTEGVVEAVSPVVSPESKTGQIVALFDNTDRQLRSGMTVDGRILTRSVQGRARIPRSAMLERDGRPLLFRLNNHTVEWIYIEPVAGTSEWVVIDHPDIHPGDTVAVDRHFAISHLQRITPRFRF
ncbi:efflux RND transporter periplasmic adaptor subunit [Balneolales bacterium ANBcel1]|nr:efflux RND transporter periplasmic adaptor subunit [Balneolales bacterium ANBcel1]